MDPAYFTLEGNPFKASKLVDGYPMRPTQMSEEAMRVFISDAMIAVYGFTRSFPSKGIWGVLPNDRVAKAWSPLGYTRDDISCEESIKANTATTVVGITLAPHSESGTIELHACWVCQVQGISDNCGAKKLWILADGAIRRAAQLLSRPRPPWPPSPLTPATRRAGSIPPSRKKARTETDGYNDAFRAVNQQIGLCEHLEEVKRSGTDIQKILGDVLQTRKLSVLVDRDRRIEQQTLAHASEITNLLQKLSVSNAELAKASATIKKRDLTILEQVTTISQRDVTILQQDEKISQRDATISQQAATVSRLKSETGDYIRQDRLQGSARAVVALSQVDKTRSSKVKAWAAFQPFALQFIGKSTYKSTRPLFLPSVDSVISQLAIARQDFKDDSNAPPGLFGGDSTDTTHVKEILQLDTLDDLVHKADQPYPPALLPLLLRLLHLRHQQLTPVVKLAFSPSLSRQLLLKKDIADRNVTSVGVVKYASLPNVYSWHPLEKLLVIYMWGALDKANSGTDYDDDDFLKTIEAAHNLTLDFKEISIEHRIVFRSECHGHIGPLTVKLVEALLNISTTIDRGIAMSSKALFAAQEPTESEILRLRLEHLAGLTADFALSRSVWGLMESGKLL